MKKTILYHIAMLGLLLGPVCAYAKPANIKPGLSYYSEEYIVVGDQYTLAEERNLEEVFKNYNYYEGVYDELERIKIFKAYKRGKIDFTEVYFYNEAGNMVRKIVTDSDNKKNSIEFDS